MFLLVQGLLIVDSLRRRLPPSLTSTDFLQDRVDPLHELGLRINLELPQVETVFIDNLPGDVLSLKASFNQESDSSQLVFTTAEKESDTDVVARVTLERTRKRTGWDIVRCSIDTGLSNSNSTDASTPPSTPYPPPFPTTTPLPPSITRAMYAAGWMEGWLTAEDISSFFSKNGGQCRHEGFRQWLANEYGGMVKKFLANGSSECSSARSALGAFYAESLGILDGYNNRKSADSPGRQNNLDWLDVLCMNADSQLAELWAVYQGESWVGTHCSAVVTLVETNSSVQLIAAHSTWEQPKLISMRVVKYWEFQLGGISANFQLSTYPGFLSSSDDWIYAPGQLLATETSLGGQGTDLKGRSQSTAPDSIRVIASFLVAVLSETHSSTFSAYLTQCLPSRTYASQWLLLDLARFTESGMSSTSILTLVETGGARPPVIQDLTETLRVSKRVGSFNTRVSESDDSPRFAVFDKFPAFTGVESVAEFFWNQAIVSPFAGEGRNGAGDLKILSAIYGEEISEESRGRGLHAVSAHETSCAWAGPPMRAGRSLALEEVTKASDISVDWENVEWLKMQGDDLACNALNAQSKKLRIQAKTETW